MAAPALQTVVLPKQSLEVGTALAPPILGHPQGCSHAGKGFASPLGCRHNGGQRDT